MYASTKHHLCFVLLDNSVSRSIIRHARTPFGRFPLRPTGKAHCGGTIQA
jgi:hypothetical protein